MNTVQHYMPEMAHTQLEASRRLAKVLISGRGRLDQAFIEATHQAVTNQLSLADAAISLRDPKELASLMSGMLAQRPENAIKFLNEMMQVLVEIQSEVAKSTQQNIQRFGANVAGNAAAPAKKVADQATDDVFNPIAGIFSVWDSAFQEFTAMAKKQMATASHSIQRAAEDVMPATMWDADVSDDNTGKIAKIAAQAAADAAATVLHGHLNSTGYGSNGRGRVPHKNDTERRAT